MLMITGKTLILKPLFLQHKLLSDLLSTNEKIKGDKNRQDNF